jgi:hypothetical protein
MKLQQQLEDFGVKLAFSEANIVWDPPEQHNADAATTKGTTTNSRTRAKRNAWIYGAFSLALYALLFAKADLIMSYCTKGGFYAIFPVGAAFLCSYVHGGFTGNFWTALGINASVKSTPKSVDRAPVTQQPVRRPRARAQL